MENIKATRMELLRFKKQLKTAKRGHKLLKDKRDGLMKKFMELIGKTKSHRLLLEEKLSDNFQKFSILTASLHQKEISEIFLGSTAKINIDVAKENVMSVWIPRFKFDIQGDYKTYSDFSAPLGLGDILTKFWDTLSLMLDLAAVEHSSRLLALEIEKTRRRVNALEYVIVPQVKKNIKFISSKLDEQERSEKIVRMKIKDIISAE